MGRAPCCDKANVKKGPWSPEEDSKLKGFIEKYGTGGNWIALPQKAGLKRCGKSCRLRWLNYLRPNLKHGEFSEDEDMIICNLFARIGSRWSIMASHLPGRTDNDIKNYWNTKLKKKLMDLISSPNKSQPQLYPLHLQTDPSLQKDQYYYTYTLAKLHEPSFSDNTPDLFNATSSSTLLQTPDCFSSSSCNYISNGYEEQKNMICYTGTSNGGDGFLRETPIGYHVDNVNQLISSNHGGYCNNLFIDENKTQGKVMYYAT